MLRRVKWESYTGSTRSVEARSFAIARMAAMQAPAGDKEQTVRGWEVLKKLRRITSFVGEENGETETWFLALSGGEVVLEAAEHTWLERAISKFREGMAVVNADALILLDEKLTNAPKIEAKLVEDDPTYDPTQEKKS